MTVQLTESTNQQTQFEDHLNRKLHMKQNEK